MTCRWKLQSLKYKKLFPKFDDLNLDRQGMLDEWELLESLGDRHSCKFCLMHAFGLLGNTPKTLSEIGKMVCRSGERVRQGKMKALRLLKQEKRRYLYPFISNEKLFIAITGYKNVREWILNRHRNPCH